MKPFDWTSDYLLETALIEASAGTGKTFTLEHTVAELIIRGDYALGLGQILVVTFMNKAAAEVKARIRRELARRLDPDRLDPDRQEKPLEPAEAARVRAALAQYDQAPVYTIHGFCQQVLQRYPLENRSSLAGQAAEDDGGLLEQALQEELRRIDLGGAESGPLQELFLRGTDLCGGFEGLKGYLKTWMEHWEIPDGPVPGGLEDAFRAEEELKAALSRMAAGLPDWEDFFAWKKPVGSRKKRNTWEEFHGEVADLADLTESLGGAVGAEGPDDPWNFLGKAALADLLEELTSLDPESAGVPEDQREFFRALHSFREILSRWTERRAGKARKPLVKSWLLNRLAWELYEPVQRRVRTLRDQAGILTYGDMIDKVYRSLQEEDRCARLRQALSREYRLVLLDEFQDTNQKQEEIFRRLFDVRLMVGDPKQSIYRFRGADLEVFYRVRDHAAPERRFTLGVNYRSTPAQVAGINRIFSRIFDPRYHRGSTRPVEWRDVAAGKTEDGSAPFRFVPLGAGGDAGGAEDLRREMLAVYADKIRGLIRQGKYRPREIAVLADTNAQGDAVQAELQGRGIASVVSRNWSVFQTEEARDLRILLEALEEPRRQALLRVALMTSWFGLSAEEVRLLEEEGEGLSLLILAMMDWREMVRQGRLPEAFDGIFSAGRVLLQAGLAGRVGPERRRELELSLEERDLAAPGGERQYTNRFHLLDELKELQLKGAVSCAELARELLRREQEEGGEGHLQRLERDDEAVQIMTVHKSKGLQFGAVFYAGGMRGRGTEKGKGPEALRYVDEGGLRVRDYWGSSAARERQEADEWEEEKRKFYVALTRAVSRVYLPLPLASKGYLPIHSHYGALLGEKLSRWAREELGASLGEGDVFPLPFHRNVGTPVPGAKLTKKDFLAQLSGFFDQGIRELSGEEPDLFRREEPGEGLENAPGAVPPAASPEAAAGESREGLGPAELRFPRDISNRYPRMTSFSALNRQAGDGAGGGFAAGEAFSWAKEDEEPEETEETEEPALETAEETADSLMTLAPGALFGDAVHALLEELEWAPLFQAAAAEELQADQELGARVKEILRRSLAPDTAGRCVRNTVRLLWEVLGCPLAELGGASLGQIPNGDRAAEMEFLIRARGQGLLEAPGFCGEVYPGFVKGFIDLVFRYQGRYYLADWKTTRPGLRPEDYGRQGLETAMGEHGYYGQGMLYTAALTAELERRDPSFSYEEDFGGFFYFFVRGMRRDPAWAGRGVFYYRPEEAELESFRRLLGREGRGSGRLEEGLRKEGQRGR